MQLSHLTLFLLIAEKGSLSAAGRALGISATTVSERLAALEAHFGVVLFNRTTRVIRLTDEGRMLVHGARQVLADVQELEGRIRHGAQALSGPIRISAPSHLGRTVVDAVANRFVQAHPDVTVELLLGDGYVDLVGEGVDIAVRFGTISDSTLRSRTIGHWPRVVCAAPAYVARSGMPRAPAELQAHNCLVMRFGMHLDHLWRFGPDSAPQTVPVRGDRVANDGALVHAWCLAGYGIALKSLRDVDADLRAGRLVALLSDYAPAPTPLQLLFPPAREQPQRVRALAEALGTALKEGGAQDS